MRLLADCGSPIRTCLASSSLHSHSSVQASIAQRPSACSRLPALTAISRPLSSLQTSTHRQPIALLSGATACRPQPCCCFSSGAAHPRRQATAPADTRLASPASASPLAVHGPYRPGPAHGKVAQWREGKTHQSRANMRLAAAVGAH